ncbi:hypothetical protein N7448_001426 [Penicillium atrosanguineum]|uniref:Uncharacterized protein n=1 Tax=Penicillium atrosanguineum TaxID=1132637 RepID=A0A9W9LC28_9EURO|nr:uncharacterized protein N7443_004823 [Penicillium atrosanguineum]KAJ5133549.1 hypothetical protein N7526_004914 [Penicillium atrosanguineum]KAJ5149848.1 hypothetical protein N7448_001426 [Penicillium atrosanguineum]KAJ5305163.1 hypothetical protein N7443_004823 [Penicillium atrosanguineum]KAJ5324628.1 hypothetical protein N7476_003228 [Penicillium atrosanguineum]
MGRQAYLNRLALGRSPYEPPEIAAVDPSNPVRRVSNIHSDSHMQQYDARGHPVNPESKALGRELRRAKNDILSTMGVVVSGEDRNASSSREQEKINQIATENDFGLVITTVDQLCVFLGTWWSSSLTGRIQAYRHYTHAALLEVIRSERGATGVLGFYLAGIPAWAVSSGLAIIRDNPLKRVFITARDYFADITGSGSLSLGVRSLFGLTYYVARSSVLLLSVEAYMYSLLQSLSLVPSNAIPSLRILVPFGKESLVQLPPVPTELSIPSVGGFFLRLMASPGVLTFLFAFYLRPELEERIYRLIRRQLPKPTVVDELSIRVAYEENLIDWVVPTLGRRSAEEMRRVKLTLFEDIKYELRSFQGWLFSFFGLLSKPKVDTKTKDGNQLERIETLRHSIESLQNELEEVQLRNLPLDEEPEDRFARRLGSFSRTNTGEIGRPDLPIVAGPTHMTEAELALGMHQVLTNENRMSQSPGEMSNDFFSEMATLGRTSANSNTTASQSQLSHTPGGEDTTADRQNSRSNTLFSRPSSPETSPPTSPRVRASLIHQSSDIITMQLELLGNRSHSVQGQGIASNLLPRTSRNGSSLRPSALPDRRSIAEFLEALILSQAAQQGITADQDGDSNVTAGASYTTAQDLPMNDEESQNSIEEAIAVSHPIPPPQQEGPTLNVPNILPDGVEEPNDEGPDSQLPLAVGAAQGANIPVDPALGLPNFASRLPGQPGINQTMIAHRVTLLSAHPVDSLASHLAAIISTIILSPLESLTLRSLAHSYLSTHPSSTTRLSDLYSMDIWFGGGSWSDRLAYTGRLFLMRGMQAALRAGVWGFLVGSTMRIGRKFCGWGSLK